MRTNEQRVLDLVYTDSPKIGVCMRSANLLVDEKLSEKGMSDDLLAEIETFLAAHFLLQNPEIRKKNGYELEKYKEGLKNTNYGQQAMMMDKSNTLKFLNKNNGFEFKVI